MGLFHPNYNTPGPGVRKDEPRKKGPARFFEILGRDMGDLFRANLLCTLGFLPALILIFLGILGRTVLLAAAGGILGGILLGPCYAGLHDTILRALRDEPGYWWHIYKKSFRRNWRQSLIPGAILGFLLASQLFVAYFLIAGGQPDVISAALICMNVLLTAMIFPYLFSQLVLIDLPLGTLVKNSLLLALSFAPRSIAAALIQIIYWIVIISFLPYTALWVVLFGFALVELIVLMIIYPALDKCFGLEERFRQQQAQRDAENRED